MRFLHKKIELELHPGNRMGSRGVTGVIFDRSSTWFEHVVAVCLFPTRGLLSHLIEDQVSLDLAGFWLPDTEVAS